MPISYYLPASLSIAYLSPVSYISTNKLSKKPVTLQFVFIFPAPRTSLWSLNIFIDRKNEWMNEWMLAQV